MEITQLSKIYPQQFATFTSNILQTDDSNRSAIYYHTITKKEAGWFGQKNVNLILKYPLDSQQQPILFYEKTIEVNQQIHYVPRQPFKYIFLSDVKMVARGTDSLTIAFLVEKKKIEEWNFIFHEKKLGEQWEMLLKNKKNQFKKIRSQKMQNENKIKDLLSKIQRLQEQLRTLKVKCEQIFSAKEVIENQNRNLYRQNITLIQENSSLNQTNSKYRKLLAKLENQSFIEEKKRKSMPNKTENDFTSQETRPIFYVNQFQWKQYLLKIESTCSNIEQTLVKNEDSTKLFQLSEQLQLSCKSLKSSLIVPVQKDIRKSSPNERMQV